MVAMLKSITALRAEDWRRAFLLSALITLGSLILPATALAQAVNINLGTGAGLTERAVQLMGLLTVLSLAPSIVIMTTSFVRIVVEGPTPASGSCCPCCARPWACSRAPPTR